ncbi:MAG: signal recognition particle protein [Acidobacteriota bacterium]
MLDNLSGRFNKVFKYLKGEVKITEANIDKALKEIKLSLLEADVNFRVVKDFISKVKEKSMGKEVQESLNPYQHIVKIVRNELEIILGVSGSEINESAKKPSVIMLTGLQGTGKTTSAGKLALFLKNRGKSSILCSFDLKRMAAGEQLEIIAKEIGVNYFNPGGDKPEKIAKKLIKTSVEMGYDYIIADTAGRLHIDDELMDELKKVKSILSPAETIFVADSMTGQDAVNSAVSFLNTIGIDSILLTKLDSDTRGGAALSIVSATGKPIKFIGTGEKYSDLQQFHPDRLASQILGMGDVLTLIEKAEKDFDESQAEKLTKKLMKNEFTLEDFLAQLKQVQKLGSISDIMGMLPNMGLNQNANVNVDDKKINHLIAIVNSMNREEREKPKIINGKRRYRIAKGSGRSVQEVNQLLKQYFEMKKFMKKPFFRKMLKKFDISSKMG